MAAVHKVTVIVEGAEFGGWSGYHIESSIITPADTFELRRPFDPQAWYLLRRDARVKILIDGVVMIDGFIDKRIKESKAGTMTVSGRDRCGRVVDESAPALDYSSMTIEQAVRQLVSPWYNKVVLSNERNRRLRRGKGKRLAKASEPVIQISIRSPRRGFVHPGMSRWQVIHEICARGGMVAFGAADGSEFVIGKPCMDQEPQYEFINAKTRQTTNVRDLTITEDDGDRYSLIIVAGTGGQRDTNYGPNVTDQRGVVFDNPFNRYDGTGRDFIHPKRLFMPEKDFDSYGDAQQVAENERARRSYKRHEIVVEMAYHGQFTDGASQPVLYAPDTIAHVVDEETGIDDLYLVVSCSFSGQREQAETTSMHLVPRGTEIIL